MLSRREMLTQCGTGFGLLGLAGLLQADAPRSDNPLALKPPHFPPRAKRIIHLYMNGGPSQVDTFDPKPALLRFLGQRPASIANLRTENGTGGLMPSPFKFPRCGKSGLPISDIYPELGKCADDLCVIRSMHTNVPNHEPSMFMMNSGHVQSVRPSYGSWLLYGLGTENQNLPGYVVLGPGHPVNGAANWSNRFLPGIYQGRASGPQAQLRAGERYTLSCERPTHDGVAATATGLDPAHEPLTAGATRPGTAARGAYRVVRDGFPHASRRPGGVRHQQ